MRFQRDPWGREGGQPPELDKLLSGLMNKLQRMFGSRRPSSKEPSAPLKAKSLVVFIVVILLLVWAAFGFFIVSPAEEAVQLRFGQYQDTLSSGPHWIPPLIDSYDKVDVQRVNSFEFNVDLLTKATESSSAAQPASQTAAGDDDTDKNVVNIELSVQYRIADPKLYLFNVANGEKTLAEIAQARVSTVVGQMSLDDVITTGRAQVAALVQRDIQQIMDEYQTGMLVLAVNVRKAQAPEEVADAFLDVVQAGQDEQRYIQQAQAYASKVLPIAQGAKSRVLADAAAYKEKVILTAQGDVAKYLALLKVYQISPQVTEQRLYIETLQNVLKNTQKVLLDAKSGNNVFYLPLDKLPNVIKKQPMTIDASTIVEGDDASSIQWDQTNQHGSR